MELTQPLRVGLGLAVGLNFQYSHPVCTTTKLECLCKINDSQEFMGISSVGNSLKGVKQHTGNFSMGMAEVQTLQMNQSHNNVVANVNRYGPMI